VLNYLRPWLDGYKIDLKSMQDKRYREMGGVLQHVLDSIKLAKELDLWVEVVTLIIPGFNDSNEELWEASRYLCSVSSEIPWHVTAYHPDYKMEDAPPTPPSTLQRAAEICQEAGLKYVYAGNLPGRVGSLEDTYCPRCNQLLVKRRGFWVEVNMITSEGKCPKCGQEIPGVWN
jgi:pyruvate formate lyase activating enzyme